MSVSLALGAGAACEKEGMRNPEDPSAPARSGNGEQTQPSETPIPPYATAGGPLLTKVEAGCPTLVAGTEVEVTRPSEAVAIRFTTATGDVSELRARVRHLGATYERGSGHFTHLDGHLNNPRSEPSHIVQPMPSVASTVDDIDGGARLLLRPVDPEELDALRQHVRMHQELMQTGHCWMNERADPQGLPE